MNDNDYTDFFGVRICTSKKHEILDSLIQTVKSGSKKRVTTMNAQIAYYLIYREGYAKAIEDSMVIPDGIGLSWALRYLKNEKIDRYPGVELVYDICKASKENEYKVFLLGAKKGVAKKAAENLKLQTSADIAGYMHGYFEKSSENNSQVCRQIKDSGADILFVGFGAPYQEEWLRENFENTGAKVAIGVGGSIDIYAGEAKRAPKFIQNANLEWLYRILQNPKKKFRVIFQIIKFIFKVLTAKHSNR